MNNTMSTACGLLGVLADQERAEAARCSKESEAAERLGAAERAESYRRIAASRRERADRADATVKALIAESITAPSSALAALRDLYDYARCWPAEDGSRFHHLLVQADAALTKATGGDK